MSREVQKTKSGRQVKPSQRYPESDFVTGKKLTSAQRNQLEAARESESDTDTREYAEAVKDGYRWIFEQDHMSREERLNIARADANDLSELPGYDTIDQLMDMSGVEGPGHQGTSNQAAQQQMGAQGQQQPPGQQIPPWKLLLGAIMDDANEIIKTLASKIRDTTSPDKADQYKRELARISDDIAVDIKSTARAVREHERTEFEAEVDGMHLQIAGYVRQATKAIREKRLALFTEEKPAATASDAVAAGEEEKEEEAAPADESDAIEWVKEHALIATQLKDADKVRRSMDAGSLDHTNQVITMQKFNDRRRELESKLKAVSDGIKSIINMQQLVLNARELDNLMMFCTSPAERKPFRPTQFLPKNDAVDERQPFQESVADRKDLNLEMPTVMISDEKYEVKIREEEAYLAQDSIIDRVMRRVKRDICWSELFERRNLHKFYDRTLPRDMIRDDVKPIYFNGSGNVSYRDFKEFVHAGIVMKANMNWFEKMSKLKQLCTGIARNKIAKCDLSMEGFIEALETLEADFQEHKGAAEEMITALLIKLRNRAVISLKDLNTVEAALAIVEEIIDCNGRAGKDPLDGQASILSNIIMDNYTERNYEAFKEQKLQSRNSLRLFITWAKLRIKDHIKNRKADQFIKNITKVYDVSDKEDDVEQPKRRQFKKKPFNKRREYVNYASDDGDSESSTSEEEVTALAGPKEPCFVCNKSGHRGFQCESWGDYNLADIAELVKKAELCEKCLRGRHSIKNCSKKTMVCEVCQSPDHHTKLHGVRKKDSRPAKGKGDFKKQLRDALMNVVKIVDEEATLLNQDLGCLDGSSDEETVEVVGLVGKKARSWMTVPVEIAMTRGFETALETNALIDIGSSATLLQPDLAKKLGAKGRRKQLSVQVVGENKVVQQPSIKGKLYVRPLGEKEKVFEIRFNTFNIPVSITPVDANAVKQEHELLHDVPFPKPAEGGIGLLIGFNNMELMASERDILVPSGPLARRTPLGWALLSHPKSGGAEVTCFVDDLKELNKAATADTEMRYLMDRQYGLESIGIDRAEQPVKRLTVAEEAALSKMKKTLKRLPNGLYEVGIPMIKEDPDLMDNFKQCAAIQRTLDKKHAKDPRVAKAVEETMAEYVRLGIIEPVPASDVGTGNFMPYFCVAREGSETTKFRFVYNAKQKFGGTSINEEMYTGPNYLDDIFDTMIQFRVGEVGVVSDIEKMYLMIALPEKDRKYVRIIVNGQQMQFCRWPFGLRAAPSVANFVVKHHIKEHGSERLREKVRIYMDDVIVAFKTVEEAKSVVNELIPLMSSCGMELRKFVSNKPEALADVPKERLGKAMVVGETDEIPVHSTLGLKWEPKTDRIGYKLSRVEQKVITKRIMASQIAAVYDPLGALTPCLLKARRALQLAHKADRIKKIAWDDDIEKCDNELTREAVKLWKQWQEEYEQMCLVSYPRMVAPEITGDTVLHFCSDGSDLAFATVAFVASKSGAFEPRWLTTKARIQGVKQRTIPEVELAGALLSARLSNRLMSLLGMKKTTSWYWVDNTSVICWIRKAGVDRAVYVRNRAIEISDTTVVKHWNHIATEINPGDVPTRGCTGSQLRDHATYWGGPQFFMTKLEEWKLTALKVTEEELAGRGDITLMCHDLGCRGKVSTSQTGLLRPHQVEAGDEEAVAGSHKIFKMWKGLLSASRVSKWSILIRAIARLIARSNGQSQGEMLEEDYLQEAVKHVLVVGQWLKYEESLLAYEKTGKWPEKMIKKSVQPMMCADGLIRVHTRMYNQEGEPGSSIYPVLVADTWPFRLYLWALHAAEGHVRNDSLYFQATKFLSGPQLKNMTKEISRACTQCKKLHAPMARQLMGAKPNLNLKNIRPCSKIAIDFTGAQWVKFYRKRVPIYVLVAVCLQTKVVTLEITTGLSTEAVVMALSRIASRRGPIEECYSDNGGSFKKLCRLVSKKEKKQATRRDPEEEEVVQIDWELVKIKTAQYVKSWKMNAPRDHEANGEVEAFVKLAKNAIRDHLDQGEVDLELYRTWVAAAENVVNSRPVAVVEQDDDSRMLLTPNHLLVGRVGDTGVFSNDDELGNVIRLIGSKLSQFRRRWTEFYLNDMHGRRKFQSVTENVKEGDAVVVAEEDLKIKRHEWTIGRVIKAIKSNDGIVRKVLVKHKHGTVERGIRQLIPVTRMPFIRLDN